LRYRDRQDAGQALAAILVPGLASFRSPPLVIGLPRGGVPVADEVARALGAPLDVWVAKKIGAPGQEELGIGAVSEGDIVVLDDELVRGCGVEEDVLSAAIERKQREVGLVCFRRHRPPPDVRGRTVIVVDDGVANGVTATAALRSLRRAGASRLLLAVPVGSRDGLAICAREADQVVCPYVPADFHAVGAHYRSFTQVEDSEVEGLLAARAVHA
jgi:putative phosphoribosyl transferase